jgi:hypothetical protein
MTLPVGQPPSSRGPARVIQGSFAGGKPRLPQVPAAPPSAPRPPMPVQMQARPAMPQHQGLPRAGSISPRLVMNSHGVTSRTQPPTPPRAPILQPSAGNAFPVPANFTLRPAGTGQRLPEAVQRKMESFFGADFSAVRVHVGSEAPTIGALAFTIGSDLYFAPGQYNPNSPEGQRLLGHELTHVVQQRAGRVRNPFGAGTAVVQDAALEAEAERSGMTAAMACCPVQAKSAVTSPTGLPPTPSSSAVGSARSAQRVKAILGRVLPNVPQLMMKSGVAARRTADRRIAGGPTARKSPEFNAAILQAKKSKEQREREKTAKQRVNLRSQQLAERENRGRAIVHGIMRAVAFDGQRTVEEQSLGASPPVAYVDDVRARYSPPWANLQEVVRDARGSIARRFETCAEAQLWIALRDRNLNPHSFDLTSYTEHAVITSPCPNCHLWVDGAFRSVVRNTPAYRQQGKQGRR